MNYNQEYIEKYLLNQLNKEELKQFRECLQSDKELSKAVKIAEYQLLIDLYLRKKLNTDMKTKFEYYLSSDITFREELRLAKAMYNGLKAHHYEKSLEGFKEAESIAKRIGDALYESIDPNEKYPFEENEQSYTLDELLSLFNNYPQYERKIEEVSYAMKRSSGEDIHIGAFIQLPYNDADYSNRLPLTLNKALDFDLEVTIYDNEGNEVFEEEEIVREYLSKGKIEIHIATYDFAPGCYYARFKPSDKTISPVFRKFYVQKHLMPS